MDLKSRKWRIRFFIFNSLLVIILEQCASAPQSNRKIESIMTNEKDSFNNKTDEQWKKELSHLEYKVLREKGTERPFSGIYDEHWEGGTYHCKACNTPLFKSENKYNPGCGWPSFDQAIDSGTVVEKKDLSIVGRPRVEILCANCNSHLGHVFTDGPKETTGLRYCINSICLEFVKTDN